MKTGRHRAIHSGKRCNRVHHGFTLIELLVVIAILAILVAMLLPAISDAKYKAKLAICATRVRNLALAGNRYAIDHFNESPNGAWYLLMPAAGYLEKHGGPGPNVTHYSLHCPIESDTGHNSYKTWLQPGWLYTLNIDLASATGWGAIQINGLAGAPPAKLDEVVDPSRCMFFSDGGWRGPTFPHRNDYYRQSLFGRTDAAWAYPPHHDDGQLSTWGLPITRGFNVSYLDGHAEMTYWQGETDDITAGANPTYEFNRKTYWGRPGSQSWNLAPFDY